MPWTTEHRVFPYDCYVKNNESVTSVRREFRCHFNTYRNQSVIQLYVRLMMFAHRVDYWIEDRGSPTNSTYTRKWGTCKTSYTAEFQSICWEIFL